MISVPTQGIGSLDWINFYFKIDLTGPQTPLIWSTVSGKTSICEYTYMKFPRGHCGNYTIIFDKSSLFICSVVGTQVLSRPQYHTQRH